MKTNHCVACGTTENIHHHHLVPKSEGGTDEQRNFITLCVEDHARIHGTIFRPQHALISRGIKKAQAKGSRPGRKIKSPPLSFIKENASDIKNQILPSLILLSYGYPVNLIVHIKWSELSSLPMTDEYRDYLNFIKSNLVKEEDYIFEGLYKSGKSNANNLAVTLNRLFKKFDDSIFIEPVISSEELGIIYTALSQDDIEAPYINKKQKQQLKLLNGHIKEVEIADTTNELEVYKSTKTKGPSLISDNFVYASYIDGIKFSEWLQINEQIENRLLIVLYLSSLRIKTKDIIKLKWIDILNSTAPRALKEESKRLMKLNKQDIQESIYPKRYDGESNTEGAVILAIRRAKIKFFRDRAKRPKNGIDISDKSITKKAKDQKAQLEYLNWVTDQINT